MLDEALKRLDAADSFAVIAWLEQQEDAPATAALYNDLVRHLYWERQDMLNVVALGRAGIQHALGHGLMAEARAQAYNLASFTWPGWDETGVIITTSDMAFGLEAARAALRWLVELTESDLRLARAHWLIGAHLLAAWDYDGARGAFAQARQYAEAAAADGDRLLAESFLALVDVLDGSGETALRKALARLAGVEHGASFVEQVETARRVFGG